MTLTHELYQTIENYLKNNQRTYALSHLTKLGWSPSEAEAQVNAVAATLAAARATEKRKAFQIRQARRERQPDEQFGL